jgi:outer membrane lipoprotein-sorting protein
MKSSFFIAIFSSLVFLQGCGLFNKTKNLSPEKLKNLKQFEKLYTQNLEKEQYEWLSATGRVKIKSSKQNVSLSAQFKSRKDSLVWARLSKLIEVARAQADVKHFQLVNRLDRSYFDYSFAELSTIIDPEQGIAAFQSLLMGNIPFNLSEATFTPSSESYVLKLEGDSINQEAIIDNKKLKLQYYKIVSVDGKTEANASFSNYTETDFGWVPQKIIVKIKGADLEAVEIDFSKIEFKKRDIVEFEIPTGYKEN